MPLLQQFIDIWWFICPLLGLIAHLTQLRV